MDFDDVLSVAHTTAGIVLFLLALTSVSIAVLIAVKPALDPANERLVKRANSIGLIENIVVVIVTLSGVIAAFMNALPLSQLWLWLSLLIMVFYSLMLAFVTTPARLVVSEGGSAIKSGMQVILQISHMLFLLVVFALMLIRPI